MKIFKKCGLKYRGLLRNFITNIKPLLHIMIDEWLNATRLLRFFSRYYSFYDDSEVPHIEDILIPSITSTPWYESLEHTCSASPALI